MKKVFIEPKLSIVEIDSKDIIATSGGVGGTIPDAPFRSRYLGDWEDFDDED